MKAPVHAQPPSTTRTLQPRILIVEDEVVSQNLLQRILAPYGDCDGVTNGREAVQAFQRAHQEGRPYDLICLDILMHKMDGLSALQMIRRQEETMGIPTHRRVRVLVITIVEEATRIMEAFRIGCDAYLIKPVDPDQILAKVEELGIVSQERNRPHRAKRKRASGQPKPQRMIK